MFQNTAFFGGSFSPPTRMHITVAIEIAKTLVLYTHEKTPGELSCVKIVPVSPAYNKASVRPDCIAHHYRKDLVVAFLQAVIAEVAANPFPGADRVRFELGLWEMESPTAVSTCDSLKEFRAFTKGDIFIAQGQDNIKELFRGTWKQCDELLRDYKFIVFPRGDAMGTVRQSLSDALGENKNFNKVGLSRADIIRKVFSISSSFSDDVSSSRVRALLQTLQARLPEDRLKEVFRGFQTAQRQLRDIFRTLTPEVIHELSFKGSLLGVERTEGTNRVKEYKNYVKTLPPIPGIEVMLPRNECVVLYDTVYQNQDTIRELLDSCHPIVFDTLCYVMSAAPTSYSRVCEGAARGGARRSRKIFRKRKQTLRKT